MTKIDPKAVKARKRLFIAGTILIVVAFVGYQLTIALLPDTEITLEEAEVYMEAGITFIDVREYHEFAKGHLYNARLIPINYTQPFLNSTKLFNKQQTFVVYCSNGERSAKAVELMREQGFTEVFNMVDGFKGWNESGLPYFT